MKIIITIILLYSFFSSHAQQGIINGRIINELTGDPIPFVNIIISNTNIGTMSDSLGHFELSGIKDEFIRLQLSSLGFEPFISEVIYVSKIKNTSIELKMTPGSETINEVTVKGRTFISKPESPVSLQSIGVDLIEKSAGANRDISKVLQSFPGVGNPLSFRNDLIVRGGSPAENKFYLDGIEIPTLNHFSTQGSSGGPIGILNVDFIREVQFYSSAFPASRGNSLSSIFEFSQKDGDQDQTSFKGSVGASELSLSINGPLSKKTTYIAGVRRSYLQFLFDQLGLPFLPTFNDFLFKTKTRINAHNEITFLGVGALDQFKLNPSPEPSDENNYILSYIPTNNQWNYTVGTVYKHFFNNSYATIAISRSHLNNSSYKYRDNIETDENLTYDYQSNEIENKLRVELTAKPNQYSINIGTNLEFGEYNNYTYSKIFSNNTLLEQQYNSDLSIIKWGVFGSVSHPFIDNRLSLALGIRMDATNYSSQTNNFTDQFSPRFSASYLLSNRLVLSGSVGQYFQLPSYTTLGYRKNNTLINKQNKISYIKSNHFVLGIEFRPNDYTRLSFEGFIKDYSQYPFSVTDSVSLASKGSNYDVFGDEEVTSSSSGRTNGFELLFKQRSPKKLSLLLSYTFVRSEFTDINNKLIPSSWDSKHLFTATISKKLKRNWDIGIKWRYIGGLPYTPYDFEKSSFVVAWNSRGREYLDYSKFNTERLDPFHQLDFRIDKTYTFNTWSIGFYFDIQNLYNKQSKNAERLIVAKNSNNEPIILNPEAPLNEQKYQLKTLQTYSGTVLPTIGINIEF
ncbi:MAG: TonB-dependent receptor [Marinilabiliaceae bacterium]|nr:TonB-dependent receptor [Marinilabiliaceae bacterium]